MIHDEKERFILLKEDTPESEKKKHRSFGNKAFDAVFYTAIAFGVVLVWSAFALYAKAMGESGKGYKGFCEGVVEKTQKALSILHIHANNPEKQSQTAEQLGNVLISFGAGTFFLAPIKYFEDRRTQIAGYFDSLNERYFHAKPVDPASQKEEPKQSWFSIIGGRITVLATMLTIDMGIGKYSEKLAQNAGTLLANAWQQLKPQATTQNLAQVKTIGWALTLETIYTAISAGLIYVSSRTIAKSDWFGKKENPPHAVENVQVISPKETIKQVETETQTSFRAATGNSYRKFLNAEAKTATGSISL